MDDLISRQAAISLPVKPKEDRYFQTQNLDDAYDYGWSDLQRCIEKLPSAQPERKTGKWNAYYHGINETPSFTYSCNQCGYSAPYGLYGGKYSQKEWNFCPNCGAKMRGEQDE